MGKKEEKTLTLKQENFCRYYVDTDGNASEAYRMAYDASKMKSESIWSAASRLLTDYKVTARVNEIKEQRAKESAVKREVVEKVLMDIIMADPSELFMNDPIKDKVVIKTPGQLPKKLRNALKKISNKKGEVTYEFNGKTEAARLLGAWNGWEADKNINLNSGEGKKIGELRIGFDNEVKSEE